jgi:hypothetical protein
MEVASTDKLILFDALLLVVDQGVVCGTVHFFLDDPGYGLEIFDDASQSLRVV